MGNLAVGRNLVLCSIVTSPEVKSTVSNAVLGNEIKRRLDSAGILTQGQPNRIPAPLFIVTVNEEYTIGRTRVETSVSIYTNMSRSISSLDISKIVSDSWNQVTTAARDTSVERPHGTMTCPPGEVFELGTRSACLEWVNGGNALGWLVAAIPVAETFYQVRTVHCPVGETGDVPRAGVGFVDSIFTSRVTDSNIPAVLNTSIASFQPPTTQDVVNAAHRAGESVNRTVTEALGGAIGMNGTDIKVIAYASLGIVGALVFVKILKEVKAI